MDAYLSPSPSSKQDATPLVILISHAHAPPLNPSPDLRYDLRTVPNPPKAIREGYTGVDKRLREHMRQYDAFGELLVRAEGDIRRVLVAMIAEKRYSDVAVEDEDGYGGVAHRDGEDEVYDGGSDVDNGIDEDDANNGPVLRVGVFCERGQHRSVAFVEELARLDWPKEWEIQILHRDLGKERGVGKGWRERGERSGKVREMDFVRDGDGED
jgi:RNase adaptor protein for sRNA GlmZ degradation